MYVYMIVATVSIYLSAVAANIIVVGKAVITRSSVHPTLARPGCPLYAPSNTR